MKATFADGRLTPLDDCYVNFPNLGAKIYMEILPQISDQKGASYSDENGIGRTQPWKTYQYSENRSISWTATFIATKDSDFDRFLDYIRTIQAAVYPMDKGGSAPFAPPPVAKIRCGQLLQREGELCAVLKSYSIKYDAGVPWDERTYLPYKFDIDMTFDVIYNQTSLPGAETILTM